MICDMFFFFSPEADSRHSDTEEVSVQRSDGFPFLHTFLSQQQLRDCRDVWQRSVASVAVRLGVKCASKAFGEASLLP